MTYFRTLLIGSLMLGPPAMAAPTFNADIRPILNKHCASCHGGVKAAGEISFVYREKALATGESGRSAIAPGDTAGSELVRRITHDDPDERMPPPKHGPALSNEEIEKLKSWIRTGAEWQEHWAFIPPKDPPAPKVSDPDWTKAPLDHFILSRLDQEELAPSPEAPLTEWLRRSSLDLTGLPPTLDELEEFTKVARHSSQSDGGPRAIDAAINSAIDRLLSSPHFGERWASMWLDLARYSDTTGFEKDPHRDIWPYRDWVIRAFNDDIPFNEFTIKQLAGDLLPNPTPGDLIATAFHRNTQNNTEGGTDDEEYRMAAVIDRVNTTWTAWQATTFACVQCHAHPYDPIPHEDYYRFLSFFNQSEDVDTNDDFPKTKVADDPARQADAVKLERQLRQSRRALNQAAKQLARKINDWRIFRTESSTANPDTGKITQRSDGDLLSSGTHPNNAVFQLSGAVEQFQVIRLSILPLDDDPKEWQELGAVVSTFEAALVGTDGKRRPVELKEVVPDFLAGPFEPNDSLRKGNAGFGGYPMLHVPRSAVFVPQAVVAQQPGDKLELTIRHGAVCKGSNQSCVLRRFRIELSNNPSLTGFIASPERSAAWQKHGELKKQYNAIKGRTIPVMLDRSPAARRPTRLFIRGNRSTLDKLVEPGVPPLFGQLPKSDSTPTRLEVAQWLVDDSNPLTARVIANRLWAELFGTGLVETLEDFGSSGTQPSHPELLDHLAIRLSKHHQWRIKPFLKELVLSATYRQSHRATPDLLERDPRNRLLARGPRQRLTAEMVRDQGLLVSGLLSRKQFGPPVYPPQPEGIWKSVYSGAKWNTSKGPDRYRRAVYTYSKRTSGYPTFLTFDAPTRDVCTARRIPTNTPLQALATLNDPAHIEFAVAFAKRMTEAGSDLRSQLNHGYRLINLTDAPGYAIETLTQLHADAGTEYKSDPASAKHLAESPEQAALVLVANTLLNSDIAMNR
jgi:hypothetical protein